MAGLGKQADPWLWPCAVTVGTWQSCLICGFRLAVSREADNQTDQHYVYGRKGTLWQSNRCSPVQSVHVSRLGGTCSDCWTPRLKPTPSTSKMGHVPNRCVCQKFIAVWVTFYPVLYNWGITGHRLNTPWIKSCPPWETTANQKSLVYGCQRKAWHFLGRA